MLASLQSSVCHLCSELSNFNEYDLADIDAINEELSWVKETGDLLHNEAMKVLKCGMEGLNQAKIGIELKVSRLFPHPMQLHFLPLHPFDSDAKVGAIPAARERL
ncbi:hypothetical protein GYH30_005409 [Glycine max]|uniref:Uncharacterized protein n=1 Tax=Glycine soja TaxID=3848 RepID=A0A445LUZ0_GLYSO|nr:hypothetical protein GYH30_005409 [Glycine max]RZC27040.1 hypothetical protein D0Y65_005271 [Glycine soja]